MVDTRLISKPKSWNGEKAAFKEWAFKVKGFVGAVSAQLGTAMNQAATFPAVIDHTRFNGEQQQLNSQLWYILLGLVDGQASAIMANVEEFNGLEAWRQFYRRGTRALWDTIRAGSIPFSSPRT